MSRRLTLLSLAIAWLVVSPEAASSRLMAQGNRPAAGPANNDQAPGQPLPPAGQQIQVVAVVNGQQITRQQLADSCMRRFGEAVLESIINKQLVYNECLARQVVITEKDVNDEIARKAASFGMSADRYMSLICTQRKLTADRYKNDFVWQEMALRRLAEKEIVVSPEELQKQMDFEFGAKVQIREIVCDSRAKAEQLLAEVRQSPETFGTVAKNHSLNPNSAAVKGLLPPLARNAASPQMEQLVFGMQPGQISDVVEAGGQFLLIKCERIFPAVQIAPADLPAVHERMIEELSEQKLADAATALFERLQNTVRIVNVYNDPALREQNPGVAAMVNESRINLNDLAEECIARFGSPMLTAEINRLLLQQEVKLNNLQITEEDIRSEISRAAEADGYIKPDGTVMVDEWLAYMTDNDPSVTDSLVADTVWPTCALKKLVSNGVTVTDEDLQKGFEANYGPRVEALAIVFDDQRQALKVWQMAAANPNEDYFGNLANQYSVDPASQANFGQVPPIQRHGGKPELEEEAFSLQAGEISKVIQNGEQYVILLCTGRTTPVVKELAEVREILTKHILDQKTFAAMAERGRQIHDDAQIDNFLEGSSQPGKRAMTAAREAEPTTRR